jgi:hypothetical protein
MKRREFLAGAASLPIVSACAMSASGPADPNDLNAAFFYGFPLYEFARTQQARTGGGGGLPGVPMNRVGHRAALADHTSRQVTAPNNDTIYSSAFLELSSGPIEVVSPTETERYFSIAFMDAFTDNFAYIGTRATRGQGGKFWVVGPQWTGAPPADVTLIRSSTNDVWMLGRTLVDGPGDLAAARAVQQRITVRQTGDWTPRPFTARTTRVEDPENFLAVVRDVLARSPGGKGQTARASRFASAGLVGGDVPSAELLARWRTTIPVAQAELQNDYLTRDVTEGGWSYQPRGVGDFGTNDRLRARTALGGLAALGEEEAMYFHATADSSGARLTGENAYRWRVPPGGIPCDAFWSLTMYMAEPDGRFFLADNPIHRYAIGDRTRGLVRNPDGSLDILIQKAAPTGPLAANWLPAPSGPLRLALRAYLPKRELRERRWRVPGLTRV